MRARRLLICSRTRYSTGSALRPLASLHRLDELALRENLIVDVTPLSTMTQLSKLSLQENRIVDVTGLAPLVNLSMLFLWCNEIQDVQPLRSCRALEDLRLAGNRIKNPEVLKTASFPKMGRLWVGTQREPGPLPTLPRSSVALQDSLGPDVPENSNDGEAMATTTEVTEVSNT